MPQTCLRRYAKQIGARFFGLVPGEVGERHQTGGAPARRVRDRVHDIVRDGSRVERVRPFAGDGAEGFRVGRVSHTGPGRFGTAVRVQEIRAGLRVQPQAGRLGGERRREARADRETVVREGDRRVEERAPGLRAVFVVDEFEQAQHAGDADGAPARPRVRLRLAAVGVADPAERVAVCGGGSRLSPVVGVECARRRVVVQQERAAAQSGGLRFDQAQHGLRRDQRVGGGPPARSTPHAARLASGFAVTTMKLRVVTARMPVR